MNPRARASRLVAALIATLPAMLPATASAAWTLALDEAQVVAGATLALTALYAHDGPGIVTPQVPAHPVLRLAGAAGERTLELTRTQAGDAPDQPLAAGQFRRVRYLALLPENVHGTLLLSVPELGGQGVLVQVAPVPRSAESVPATPAEVVADRSESAAQKRFESVSAHDPMYFIVGSAGNTNAKFQLSFKFRLFDPDDAGDTRLVRNLFIGYTQTSLWDLQGPSKPFTDSSYRPALFYHHAAVARYGAWTWGLQAGLEHESNGKAGVDSRSLNTAFVRPLIRWGPLDDAHWTFAPKLYAYLDKEENPDIQRYRGYGDFTLRYGRTEGWQLGATLRLGTERHHGSTQVDFTVPMSTRWLGNLNGYLYAQYVYGWGESLLTYNQKTVPQLRLGIMVVR